MKAHILAWHGVKEMAMIQFQKMSCWREPERRWKMQTLGELAVVRQEIISKTIYSILYLIPKEDQIKFRVLLKLHSLEEGNLDMIQ